MKEGLLLYGANGYTGRLILAAALRQGLWPTIAGRRREAIEPLARAAGVDFRVFELSDRRSAAGAVAPFSALLLAAGPFSRTSDDAFEACLAAGVSYLDITGEVPVFERLFAREEEARSAGIAALPGAGFDVVPSDCLAALLAGALPGASRLLLAFRGFRPSPGTARTMLEALPRGGLARIDRKLVRVPLAWDTREIPFRDRPRLAMTVPWGDLSTAWRSTGIPNIATYAAATEKVVARTRRLRAFAPLLSWKPLRAWLERRIERRIIPPDAAERARERSQLWGRVEDDRGGFVEGRMETMEGYAFTAESAVACAREILAGAIPPGVWTPSRAFGAEFVRRIPGTIVEPPGG